MLANTGFPVHLKQTAIATVPPECGNAEILPDRRED
jgi:hypothetical protein